MVSTCNREILALPIIRRFTEYRAIMVRIPARRAGIFNLVHRIPVIIPPSIPAKAAASMAGIGLQPATRQAAAVAAPRGKLPSTVKSAISSTLKVMYTPIASRDHSSP